MALLKKSLSFYINFYEQAENLLEMAESDGIEMIRVRSAEKSKMNPMHGVQSITPQSVSGFEVYNPYARKKIDVGKLWLYPAVDHYCYGYVPVTPRNLHLLAAFHSGGAFIADPKHKDSHDIVAEAIEELGCRTERNEKKYNFGIDERRKKQQMETKKRQLENLKEKVEEKKIDDELAALQAELDGSKDEVPVEEIVEEVVEEIKEEPKQEEKTPASNGSAKSRRSLAGKTVNKKTN